MILTCTACGGLYATENLESFAGTPCRCGTHSFEDKFDDLTSHITKLESSLAELQRVVQVKDEALKPFAEATEACKRAFDTNYFKVCEDGPSQPPNTLLVGELRTARKAMECTPKDLPAFIPEEEFLRVKEESERFAKTLLDITEKAVLLKTHAEAMADCLDYFDGCAQRDAYRKDFPKSTSTDSL